VERIANPEPDLKSLTVEQLVTRLRESPVSEDAPPDAEDASPYLEEIIRRFEPLLRKTWRPIAPATEYPDFVHDVFVKLFGGLGRLHNAKAFPGYFHRVVLSVASDHYRKWRGIPHATAPALEEEEFVGALDEELQTAVFIRSYLEHLPPNEREVIYLEYFRDMQSPEIAKKLKLHPGAVRKTKSRALSRLRNLFLDDAEALDKNIPVE